MKKAVYGILVLCMAVMATGCTKGDKAKKTTLYIEENGKVTEAIVEAMDKDYYNAGELEDWIDSEVETYNKENGNAVKVKKCEVKDDKARVTIKYDSLEDYSAFNQVKAFCGTIEEAEKAGYDFQGEFVSVKDKPSITYAELEGSTKYKVVIVETSQKIVLEEEILYASSCVTVKDKTATVEAGANELAYIIYK